MSESRHIAETEAEDYDNEIFESVRLDAIESKRLNDLEDIDYAIDGLFDESPEELERDTLPSDVPSDEIPSLDIADDDYNELENY